MLMNFLLLTSLLSLAKSSQLVDLFKNGQTVDFLPELDNFVGIRPRGGENLDEKTVTKRGLQDTNGTQDIPGTIRINAGGPSWTDPASGLVWLADLYYNGASAAYSNCGIDIAGTNLDMIFCSHRYFVTSSDSPDGNYSIPVPTAGSYTVKLLFAEIFFVNEAERIFKVMVNGQTVDPSLDVYGSVGANTADILTTTVNVASPGNTILIEFVNEMENPMISGVEIIPTSVSPSPPAPSPPTSPLPSIRINAGSSTSWTDPNTGFVWLSDRYYKGGWNYASCPLNISNTDQDAVFCSQRTFCCDKGATGGYIIPIPAPGQYTVNLLFAEIYFGAVSSRVFDVYLQGNKIESSFDIYNEVGKNAAYVLAGNVTVPSSPSKINVTFVNDLNNAVLNGIEIVSVISVSSTPISVPNPVPTTAPAVAPTTTESPSSKPTLAPNPLPTTAPAAAPIVVNGTAQSPVSSAPHGLSTSTPIGPASFTGLRINVGGTVDWTDPSTGLLWKADNYFTGGWVYDVCPRSISLSNDLAPIYCSQRTMTKEQYNIPVPAAGQYSVTLLFAELWWWDINQRLFKVTVQGKLIQSSLDLYSKWNAANTAIALTTVSTVDPSKLFITIELEVIKDNAVLNGIQIVPGIVTPAPTAAPIQPPFTGIRINAGGGTWTDPATGLVWDADKYYENGNAFNACPDDLAGTDQDMLYCSYRFFDGPYGFIGTYNIPVSKGLYTVRILVVESYWTLPSERLFDVNVQGITVAPALDLVAVAGYRQAYEISTIAAVTPVSETNYLKIQTSNIINNGLICGIEIMPYTPPPNPNPPSFPGLRINCGYDQTYVDNLAQTWVPDQSFIGGYTWSKIIPDILNTASDALYFYERVGGDTFTYNITVPPGDYQVTLYFVETLYNQTGQRVFDIQVGTNSRLNYDILGVVPSNTATTVVLNGFAGDGILSIVLTKSFASSGPPKLNAIQILLDTPHLAHSVARGPYYGTDSDGSGKAKISLEGQASHTHAPGCIIVDALWKSGSTILGNTLDLDYTFPVGNQTIALTVTDTNGNKNTEATTVAIRPFGFPTITSLYPNSGSITGGYTVQIIGAGFTYPATETSVLFGQVLLTGQDLDITDQYTIKVNCPPSLFGQQVVIKVITPMGESEDAYFNYVGSVPLLWSSNVLLSYQKPTVGRFGPDRKLYVGVDGGDMIKITMNADYTQVVNTVVKSQLCPTGPILGIAFDPMDTKSVPDVYFTCNIFFHGWPLSTSGPSIGGKLMMASGPNLETVTTLISGLPDSDHDHGLNAITFGDRGELYITSGSNTNGGVPGPLSHTSQLKEHFLSGAIIVAYLSHPDFNGTLSYTADDDGNMIGAGVDLHAVGLRNAFGATIHSNGRFYAAVNGPNTGYGAFSTGCGDNDQIPEYNDYDTLLLIEKGKYYGHPNKKRATYFNDPRQCVWHTGLDKGINNTDYTGPLVAGFASRTGLLEYHSNHFAGQLRRNLISVQFPTEGSFHRIILNDDGSDVVPQSKTFLPMNIGSGSVDATQAPNGNLIDIRYNENSIAYYSPIEPTVSGLTVKTVFPYRGPSAGGNILSIYGINFGTDGTTVIVTVGSSSCPIVTITDTQIDCTLPGGTGTVDITVSNNLISSTFDKGYRYVSGVLEPGFQLPIYTG